MVLKYSWIAFTENTRKKKKKKKLELQQFSKPCLLNVKLRALIDPEGLQFIQAAK